MRWLALMMLGLVGCTAQPVADHNAAPGDPNRVTHDLTGTRWALAQLAGETVSLGDQAREPFIALESPTPRVVGHAGCNRLTGGYTLSGDQVSFTSVATTRIYCEHMAVETQLLQALDATRRW